ncbi:MAG: tRNA (guanosine(37)-N1)-methyltransferase TrmD [Spirochaetes bacterium GWD1_61_31]|nr:MAG: tRNA (guanosine(37)-N1)-methyltransferase TrmD [Spirochaetes bacterium GWB1_60_80]OHD31144.1 MAG: tRNA (guanosine(37)-N1)-methyltransferase TrmD [Spirochaetes bacterium GWC1_61_12]OHD35244.1 MAG: tRNA (guanosine(37)-N1)-methyltransferase TrmD [Spirochaetes bacterium GWD1_61_31]OHD41458.1 MAG: tRNA (guanosine(37)-N1)-methyltransferase TrmD [Spirochaetes bacterium GWE1_60_18]OHD61360.1 MAG: tRNA (guanosine(37)-N1)-methyltransferase TrmD [Spirochaetes bacterium GWF1_60_12]HAP43359.1 tRNA 
MKLSVLSLFPGIMRGFFESSIMARAVQRGLVSYDLVDIRDFANNKHNKVDDELFGGGPGMLMMPGALSLALEASGAPGPRVVYVTPGGRLFNQAYARDLAKEENLVLLCGRYEGIDQRIIDKYVTDEVSIGDYVLSSGEVAALAIVDAIYRLIPGVITGESLDEESFEGGLLEYPQYTRPAVYDTLRVPEVLVSGHHANIEAWRYRKRLEKTLLYRPDLLSGKGLDDQLRQLVQEILDQRGEE